MLERALLLLSQVAYKELLGNGKQDDALDYLLSFLQARQGQCGIIYARLRCGSQSVK